MKKLFILLVFSVTTLNLFSQTAVSEGDKIIGVWLRGNGKSKIKITKYGDKYGGKVIWLKEPNNADGTPKVDSKNPDKTKQSNPILGNSNLLGFTYAGKKEYEGGSAYNPDDGKTYKCVMTLTDDTHLKIRGYVGIQLFGKSEDWIRSTE